MTSIPKTGAPQLDSFVEEGDDDAADLLACLVLLGMLSIDGDDFGHGDAPSAREENGRGRESRGNWLVSGAVVTRSSPPPSVPF